MSDHLTRRLLLNDAANSDAWKKLRATYQNHSGATLEELQFFATMAVNIFINIQRAIGDIQASRRMQSSTIGSNMPDPPPAQSLHSPEERSAAQDARTKDASPALSSLDIQQIQVLREINYLNAAERIRLAEDLGLKAVAEYLANNRWSRKPPTRPEKSSLLSPVSETLEVARQAMLHHYRAIKSQQGD
ncbi:MAG TPA: hypothetical protein VF748_14730 [Candidatus Acidoferrum sp.]